MTTVTVDVDAVAARVREQMADNYTLLYVTYDDRLSEEQVQAVFADGLYAVEGDVADFLDDYARWEAARATLREMVSPLEWEALQSADLEDELNIEIQDRDDSDLFPGLVRNTRKQLVRYRLGNPNDDYDWLSYDQLPLDREARRLCRMAKLDWATNAEAFRELVDNGGTSGTLDVIWYAEVDDLVWACNDADTTRRIIEWTDPHIVLMDRFNGSGWDVEVTGTIRRVFERRRLLHDRKGPGYGWDETAGVYMPAYDCKWRITPKPKGR